MYLFRNFVIIKFMNLVKSDVEVVLLFSFSRVDTDVKYSFSLFAISRESVICSLSMLSSVGKELVDILGLFAVRRCCQIAFVSLKFVTDSEKCLRLAFRIKFFLSCFCIVCSRSNYFCSCCYLYFFGLS